MSEELARANDIFREFMIKLKKKYKITGETESLLYFAFITGFNANSGMRELVT